MEMKSHETYISHESGYGVRAEMDVSRHPMVNQFTSTSSGDGQERTRHVTVQEDWEMWQGMRANRNRPHRQSNLTSQRSRSRGMTRKQPVMVEEKLQQDWR